MSIDYNPLGSVSPFAPSVKENSNPPGKGINIEHILGYARILMMPVLGMVIGLLGGFGALGFRYLIDFFQTLIYGSGGELVTIAPTLPWWRVVLGPIIGGAFVGPLVYFLASEAKGHGVPEVMNSIAREGGIIRKRVVVVATLASALSIGSGGSVGREGPIVLIGSALGSTFGQILKLSTDNMRVIVACGAAAGIAATFNAPIAGAIFALEIVLADFAPKTFTPIMLSSVTATVVSRTFVGDYPAFQVPAYHMQSLWEIAFCCILGLLAGLVAVSFTVILYKSEDLWDAWKIPGYLKASIGGMIIGIIALKFPHIMGVGYGLIEKALRNQEVWMILILLVPLKILATSITIGSGGSGGVFAPSLYVGAMFGGAFGCAVHALFPSITANPGAYAVIGMGAVVAGTTHAPIQAFLIIFELTQDYRIIPPLMIGCVIATFIARAVKRESIYTLKLLRRGVDIEAGRDVNILKSLFVTDYMTRNPETISESTPLRELIRILPAGRHTSFPVVGAEGNLVGMLSFKDFREAVFEENLMDVVIARDIATIPAISVTEDDNLSKALMLIDENSIERLPVVEKGEKTAKLVGILSQRDIMSAYNRTLQARGLLEKIESAKSGV